MMDVFDRCAAINDFVTRGKQEQARDSLIRLLDGLEQFNEEYPPLVNHLIRECGLYPYIRPKSANWGDRFAYEAFKTDTGSRTPAVLHRAQSQILKRLLDGESLAISAPTSFGKSFIIDSFIALAHPKSIMILVPTIALMDETRRRLYKKFSTSYKIITTADTELAAKNIFIFPQERAFSYLNAIDRLDMLVVDEFYKASKDFDKDRAPSLLRAIIKLGEKSNQRYFLAPNIKRLGKNPFTRGMEFLPLDFNTVVLNSYNLYVDIKGDESLKSAKLLEVLRNNTGKTLIYAGTYSNIEKVSNLLTTNRARSRRELVRKFSGWLGKNYDPNWALTNLSLRGVGIHNGRLHRSLSQIQIKLFEEEKGLDILVSTSSIIEGVNTSAENVILWRNRSGSSKLTDFTYKNIIGRGGRMFKHFVGNAFILEAPPEEKATQLELKMVDELTSDLEEDGEYFRALTHDKQQEVRAYHAEMNNSLGAGVLRDLQNSGELQSSDSMLLLAITRALGESGSNWRSLGFLNDPDPAKWDNALYKLINLRPGAWECEYNKFVGFIKALGWNWSLTIPELLAKLDDLDLGLDDLFKLERNATYKLASLANDVNVLQRYVLDDNAMDISAFVFKVSYAFLPPVVFQLEEFGLPRMISRKIHAAGVIDLEAPGLEVNSVLAWFADVGYEFIVRTTSNLDSFDEYVLTHFFDGISPQD